MVFSRVCRAESQRLGDFGARGRKPRTLDRLTDEIQNLLLAGGELDGARILGPRTIELMRRNHLKDGADIASMGVDEVADGPRTGVGFGLGFASTLDPVKADTPVAGDYYWGGAASTLFWIDPQEDLVVVFMTQLMPTGTFNFRAQLKNLVYSSIVE